MEFLNTDWANRGNNKYMLEVPAPSIIRSAIARGYECIQQVKYFKGGLSNILNNIFKHFLLLML